MYNDAYDEGYRAGMQKMREVGDQRIKELEAALLVAEELAGCVGHLLKLDKEMGTHSTVHNICEEVLADYRKATEVSSE